MYRNDQCLCQSYIDEGGTLQDCTCGKCAKALIRPVRKTGWIVRLKNLQQYKKGSELHKKSRSIVDKYRKKIASLKEVQQCL